MRLPSPSSRGRFGQFRDASRHRSFDQVVQLQIDARIKNFLLLSSDSISRRGDPGNAVLSRLFDFFKEVDIGIHLPETFFEKREKVRSAHAATNFSRTNPIRPSRRERAFA